MRKATLAIAIAGWAGSVGFTMWAGRRNPSWLLIAVFVAWVSLPFAALVVAASMSNRWPVRTRATLCASAVLVTACSLLIYGHDAVAPEVRTRAFVFLVAPPVSTATAGALLLLSSRFGAARRRQI